jgi:hypothetical protein
MLRHATEAETKSSALLLIATRNFPKAGFTRCLLITAKNTSSREVSKTTKHMNAGASIEFK